MAQLPQRRRSPLARTLTASAARLPGALRRLLCCAPGRRAGAARGPSRPGSGAATPARRSRSGGGQAGFDVGRAAIMLLLAIAALAVVDPAQAQTELTLVSNLDGSTTLSTTLEARREAAQQFQNGSEALAVLSQVKVYTGFANPTASNLVVSLWSSVLDSPGEKLVTFTNPSDVTTGSGVKTFTSPGPGALLLQPMTSYFVVFSFSSTTGNFSLGLNRETAEPLAKLQFDVEREAHGL